MTIVSVDFPVNCRVSLFAVFTFMLCFYFSVSLLANKRGHNYELLLPSAGPFIQMFFVDVLCFVSL